MRTVVDDNVDRVDVEGRQRPELTTTNRPIGLAWSARTRGVSALGRIQGFEEKR